MAEQRKVSVRIESKGNDVYHHVEGLPKYQQLNAEVKQIVAGSTYWEKFGKGLVEIGSAIPLQLVSVRDRFVKSIS